MKVKIRRGTPRRTRGYVNRIAKGLEQNLIQAKVREEIESPRLTFCWFLNLDYALQFEFTYKQEEWTTRIMLDFLNQEIQVEQLIEYFSSKVISKVKGEDEE